MVFTFFTSGSSAVFGALSLLNYLLWGLSLVDTMNGALIFLAVSTFTQALVGIYGDEFVSKYGRRKPLVVVGCVIRYIAILLLATPPVKNTNLIFPWYIIFGSLFSIGVGIQSNPFNSWIIESTANDEDFMKINTISKPIGLVFGSLTLAAILIFISPAAAGVVALIGGLLSLTSTVYVVPSVIYRQAPAIPKPIPSLRICLQSQEFRTILYMSIFLAAAQSTFASLSLYVISSCFHIHRVKFVNAIISDISTIGAMLGMILTIACQCILQKIDKIRVLALFLFILSACASISFFLSFRESTLYFYCALIVVIGVLSIPLGLISSLFLRDLVVFDTMLTSKFIVLSLCTT
jgi:Na+/melibiose symporter-like transporter